MAIPAVPESGGETPVHVAVDGRLAGILFIADTLRPGAKEATEQQLAVLSTRQEAIEASDGDIDEILAFAEKFFKELPALWRGFDLNIKKRLQIFFFPEGLEYNRETGCRTANGGHLSGLRALLRGELSGMVGGTGFEPVTPAM